MLLYEGVLILNCMYLSNYLFFQLLDAVSHFLSEYSLKFIVLGWDTHLYYQLLRAVYL